MSAPPDFDRLYVDEIDPWLVGSSWYEERKVGVVLAALAERRYAAALDPACGTGHLARALADRCDAVLACDASAPAIAVARTTCAGIDNVTLAVHAMPYRTAPYGISGPLGPFDLVVLSEVLYYLDAENREAAALGVIERAAPRVEVVAVHWRERTENAVASGDEVHAELREIFKTRGFRHQVAHFDEEFVLDVFTRGHDNYIP